MVLAHGHVVLLQDRREDDCEVVLGVFVDLRPLVLVLDVLDRQRVELERLLEEDVIVLVGRFDVEPETRRLGIGEAAFDVLGACRWRLACDGEQCSQDSRL
jgi:hypothetical protein